MQGDNNINNINIYYENVDGAQENNNLGPEDVALNNVLNRQDKMTEDCTRIIEDLKMLFKDAIKKVKKYCETEISFNRTYRYAVKLYEQAKELYFNYVKICDSGIADIEKFLNEGKIAIDKEIEAVQKKTNDILKENINKGNNYLNNNSKYLENLKYEKYLKSLREDFKTTSKEIVDSTLNTINTNKDIFYTALDKKEFYGDAVELYFPLHSEFDYGFHLYDYTAPNTEDKAKKDVARLLDKMFSELEKLR